MKCLSMLDNGKHMFDQRRNKTFVEQVCYYYMELLGHHLPEGIHLHG